MSALNLPSLDAIPRAPVDDLDLARSGDEQIWESRVMELANLRIQAARARLESLGVVDASGHLVSVALPPDMLPDSDATLETG